METIMENIALKRLDRHLEATDQLAHPLVGFRKHVTTQDVAKMIKEQVGVRQHQRSLITHHNGSGPQEGIRQRRARDHAKRTTQNQSWK